MICAVNEKPRAGDFMTTYTGKKFWPLDPDPADIDILDISHALSNLCRYNGHCRRFYSVAEHSVLVSFHSPGQELWGLLHDASEAYLSDLIRPVKRHLPEYQAAETRLMAAVCARFGLPEEMPAQVKEADNRILADEAGPLMGQTAESWGLDVKPLGCQILGLSPKAAKIQFLHRFEDLFDIGAVK